MNRFSLLGSLALLVPLHAAAAPAGTTPEPVGAPTGTPPSGAGAATAPADPGPPTPETVPPTTDAPTPPPPTTPPEKMQPPPKPTEPPPRIDVRKGAPPPPPPAQTGRHLHDGLYVRFGLGFSGFGDTIASREQMHDEPRDQGTVSGFGTASEIAVGGTLGRGFVLGGGIYGCSVLTTTFEYTRGTPPPDELRRPDNFSIVGLMGDWYFNPRRGFHAQAALGLAALSGVGAETQRIRDRRAAVGGGVMLGIGHEWWVSDEWGIGILGRVTAGVVTEKDDLGERWFHLVAASPSILFSATFH